jgi:flagellar hook-length control protein FliK
VLSVTSETAANLPVLNAPARSTRADQTPAPGSFSALIDSNAADDRPAMPTPPERPSQRPDQPSTTSDGQQSRDAASSSKTGAKTPSQDDEPNAVQPAATGSSVDAGAVSKPIKPGATKTGIVKTATKDAALDIVTATDSTTSADPAASAQAAAVTSVTPAAVAAAIAVPIAATDFVAASAPPASTTEPLAIAAAAIATSTSTVEASKPVTAAVQGAGDQAKPASAAATPATVSAETTTIVNTPVAATMDAAVPAAAVTVSAQAAATDAVATPVSQPAAKADAATPTDIELAATVAAVTRAAAVAPKAAPKTTAIARSSENAAPVTTGIAPRTADPSAAWLATDAASTGVAPQGPAADGKPKPDGGAVDAAKTGPANTDAPATAAAAAAPHEHRAVAAQVQTDTPDLNQAANAVQQPQAPSATTPAATQLTVTAATTAAVPLNGLALQIAVSAQSGRSRFEIRLDPAELGRIDVRVDVDRHGQLTSHLTVEKPETLAMLRQDAPQLQRALDNAGFKTGDGGLQFSLRDQSSSGQNAGDQTGRNAQRLIISEDDTIPASVAGRTYGRMSGSGSGVDIRV